MFVDNLTFDDEQQLTLTELQAFVNNPAFDEEEQIDSISFVNNLAFDEEHIDSIIVKRSGIR